MGQHSARAHEIKFTLETSGKSSRLTSTCMETFLWFSQPDLLRCSCTCSACAQQNTTICEPSDLRDGHDPSAKVQTRDKC